MLYTLLCYTCVVLDRVIASSVQFRSSVYLSVTTSEIKQNDALLKSPKLYHWCTKQILQI